MGMQKDMIFGQKWNVINGIVNNSHPCIVRYDNTVRDLPRATLKQYPHTIELQVPFIKAQKNGLPTLHELERINGIEEKLTCGAYMDFHEENFGFLYNPGTFEVIGVAPAFDFNSDFTSWRDVNVYYEEVLNDLPEFINNNRVLIPKLQNIDSFVQTLPYITKEDKAEIAARASHILTLVDGA